MNQVWHSTPGQVPQHSLAYNQLVAEIIGQTNLDSLVSFVRILSGEDSVVVGSGKILIRNRGTQEGSDLAAEYLKEKLASYNLEVHDQVYSGTGRNIYAKQMGYLYPESEYVICAHYDAVSTNNADDNASGAAGVLEAARLLSAYGTKYTLVYAFWDEEEIGLVGSHSYASQASSNQEQIQGVLNLDMIGWDANDDYLADIHTQNTASSNDIANLLVVVDYLYNLPVNPIIYNPGTWQSDHSSFWNRGFGAVLLIEAYYGGDLNPYYHTDGDSVGNLKQPFFHSMAKLSIAAMSTLAEATNDALIATVVPDVGYQTYQADIHIKGLNTHFQREPATTKVWLSRDTQVLNPDSIRITSDTSLRTYINIPLTAALGSWDVNVETATDSILTKTGAFTVLPPPGIIAVTPESLHVALAIDDTSELFLRISNIGSSGLHFTASCYGGHYALRFDGVDDMVVAQMAGLPVGNSDRTMELWFSMESHPYEEGTLVAYGEWGYWAKLHILLLLPQHLCFSQWGWACVGSTVIQPHQWYHGAVVNKGNDVTLYLNGGVDQTGTTEIATGSNGSFVMGKAPTGFGSERGLNGTIDEVRIWTYARTQSQIQSDMHRELTGTEPGLAGYWQFNDSTGITVDDLSGNANRGSLVGGPQWVTSSAPVMPMWLSLTPDSGECLPQSSVDIRVSFDATRIGAGHYYASLRLSTNDPFRPSLTIPVHLEVSSALAVDSDVDPPLAFNLSQNYPNPFNPVTTIKYELPQRTHVSLKVFDLLGQEVAVLVDKEESAGYKSVEFDASTHPSGIYFYSLTAGDFVATQKCILIR